MCGCADNKASQGPAHFFLNDSRRLFSCSPICLRCCREKEVDRAVQKGDYLKIDIPGPGSVSGEGFDWVQVEAVEEASAPEKEHFGFRVRPAENPLNNKPDVSHFYSPESTSSFTVTRDHSKITAAVFDRNTKVNKPEHSKIDKIRDAVVGTAGIVSFSKIQWKALTDGLVKSETD